MAEPSKEQSDASASGNAKAAPAAKSANAGQSGVQAAAPQAGAKAKASSQDAIALLTKDHREVDELFKQFEGATSRARKQALVEQACRALELHTQLEEQIFYPACREAAADDDPLDEAQVEHDTVKLLIADLRAASAGAPYYDAKVKVLSEYVRHHVGEEEGADGIFARARKDGVDLDQLGERIRSEKERLGRQAEGQSQSLTLVALRTGMGRSENQDYPKERTMARAEYGRSDYRDDDRGRGGNRGNDRDRDEYGRFTTTTTGVAVVPRADGTMTTTAPGGTATAMAASPATIVAEAAVAAMAAAPGATTTIAVAPPREAVTTTVNATAGVVVAGSAIPKAIPKPRAEAGITTAAAKAAGSGIPTATPRHRAGAGTTTVAAKAAGSAIPKATPKPRAEVGMIVAARADRRGAGTMTIAVIPRAGAATMTTGAVVPRRGIGTTTAAAARRGAVVRAMTTIAATVAGSGIRGGIPKPRAAAGKAATDLARPLRY